MSRLCAVCGAPVTYWTTGNRGEWMHSAPLAELRVSGREAADVMEDLAVMGHGHRRRYDRLHRARPERDGGEGPGGRDPLEQADLDMRETGYADL